MKHLKVLPLLIAATGSVLLGWGGIHLYQERSETARFQARQSALLAEEYDRLRAEVLKIDPGATLAPEPEKGSNPATLEAAIEPLRKQIEGFQRSRQEAVEIRLTKEIEEATTRIRGLEFKEPVSYNVLDRSEIAGVIEKKISEQYTEEEFEKMVAGYAAIGLIPEGFPMRQTYIDLLGEQIAAFYDQHEHKLFMFRGNSLTNAQNRVILSHELTHALQDQHFTLKNLPLEEKNNDDRVLAAAALVEGDATLEMQLFMIEDLDGKGAWQTAVTALTQNVEKLASAPRILRESLLFPYLEGAKFCTALQLRGPGDGFKPIDLAFQRPPSSTAQILHPEKYHAKEEPILIPWATPEWKGEAPSFDNVMGEFATRVLLTEWGETHQAAAAAEGWRGDRYLVFGPGKVLIWRSLWSDLGEAEEFAASARRMLDQRYQTEGVEHGKNTLVWKTDDRTTMLKTRLREAGVVMAHAPTLAECEEVLAKFESGQ